MDSRVPSALELPQPLEPHARDSWRCLGEEEQHLLSSTAAVQTLANVIRPCYGPHGRQKLLVTAKGETVCTGHAAAILRALELEHPAAWFLREAAQTQAENTGDGTSFVVLLTEALLEQAEHLLKAGLPRSQLREAFAAATAEALSALPSLAIRSLGPLEDPSWALYSVMNTHALSHADYLTKLVANACWASRELDGSFRAERVGVCALQGGSPEESCLLPGLAMAGKLVVLRGATIQGLRGAEQAVYHGIDAYFQLCQDPRLIPGAGATEMALAKMLYLAG